MDLQDKLEPLIIFSAIIIGLLLSNINIIAQNTDYLINIFLCLMLFGVFLEVPLSELKDSFKNHKYTTTSLLINFIWTPLFGYFIGNLFLKGNIDILIGFFMLILTPCTDWYLVFTNIAKGDVKLNLSILPINLIVQIVLLPIYLIIFFSTTNTLDYMQLINSLVVVIIIPLLAASLVKIISNNSIKEKITNTFSNFETIFLALAVVCIFASQANLLFTNLDSVLPIFIPLILFFTVNFTIDYLISKKITFTYEEYASLTMTTLARP